MGVAGRDRILARARALRTFDVEVPHLDGETVRFREITGDALEALQKDLQARGGDDESMDSVCLLLSRVVVDESGAPAFEGERGIQELKTLPAALLLFLGQKAGELVGLNEEAVRGEAKN